MVGAHLRHRAGSRGAMTAKFAGTLGSRIGIAALGFIGGVLTARGMTPSDRGLFSLSLILVMAGGAAAAGVQFAAARAVSHGTASVEEVASPVLALAAGGGLLITAVVLVVTIIAGKTAIPWLIASSSLPGSCMAIAAAGIYLGREKMAHYNVLTTAAPLMAVIGYASLWLVHAHSLNDFLVAWAISQTAVAVVAFAWLRHALVLGSLSSLWKKIKQLLGFSYSVSLNNLASLLNLRADVFVVAALLSRRELGYYSVALQMAEALWLVSGAATLSIYGRTGRLDRADAGALVAHLMRHVIVLMAILTVLTIALAGLLVPVLYGNAYIAVVPSVRILVVGVGTGGVVSLLAAYFTNQIGKPSHATKLALWGAGLNVVLSLGLVPRFGLLGAATATSTSYIVQVVLGLRLFRSLSGLAFNDCLLLRRADLADYAHARTGIARLLRFRTQPS